jgi:L-rhamnose mutarotase
MIHRETFTHEITSMNITESHLLVYTSDCVIRYFSLHVKEENKLVFRLQQALSLQDFMGSLNKSAAVKCIARYPPSCAPIVKSMSQNPILLLKNGQLYRISKTANDSWDAIKIADKVEHFWVSNHQDDVMQLQSSIWIFDGSGAKV